ncbi:RNA polymerase sigma factor [Mucilaginibacter glaciei]|uniref:Sigma-70 family RNA polymerase sigma factor n=1 Tax=Mucilaginibacter glaciei TaxID=2772109 RepID=A0A926NPJ2_9SPHI|nr:sigma-70 family RNA polymerase sigma factor [Mucilaginibacter glaciei]MBD1392702.1 sigma-70 family RNA polymerase sigma factor [Mucilaginibacter glaciei]
MKPQLVNADTSLQANLSTKQDLFNRFGGMLLGYISEVVKSSAEAEQYLIDIFSQLQAADIRDITAPGKNTFIYLQSMARKKLASFVATVDECADVTPIVNDNKFVNLMAPEQQVVFCGMHYHGKTITKMAAELNKPEATIKQLLREAFTVIRSNK